MISYINGAYQRAQNVINAQEMIAVFGTVEPMSVPQHGPWCCWPLIPELRFAL